MKATSESIPNPDNRNTLESIGEALIVAAGAFSQPLPPLPSAGEIDAAIERKLHQWDLERRAARARS